MTIFLNIVLCFGVVLAQAILSTILSVKGIYPDLCFILACMIGFLSGEYKGLMIGLTVGLLQDLLTPGGIGLNMIIKALAGGLAGITTHTFSTVTSAAVLLVTFALSLGCGLASLVVAYPVVDAPILLHALSSGLLPQGLYNSLLTLGMFWLIKFIGQSVSMVHLGQGPR
ncbi:MAG: rod shape-determining protein MreD [Nitrospirales bacterium]|nr:rod shape-determining protein MreD [Nitrospirales bacterium]MBA3964706.1 rod shape-determining protein MreD [Nitrospirales bacterium]